MYLIGVYNYFMKYIVQNSYNKISMGHFAHLRNQYNFPCYFPFGKEHGLSFEQTRILFTQECFVPILVKIVQSGSEEV